MIAPAIPMTHRPFPVPVTIERRSFVSRGRACVSGLSGWQAPIMPPTQGLPLPSGVRTLFTSTAAPGSGRLHLRFARRAQPGLITGQFRLLSPETACRTKLWLG